MISRCFWSCLLLSPQSVAVTAIGWESVAVEATISIPGIGLRLGLSGPLPVSVAKTSIAIAAIAKAKTSVPGIGLRLGLSRPLSVSVAKTSIAIAQAKTVAIKSTISVPGIGLRLSG